MKQITQEQVKESKRGMIVIAVMLLSILSVGTIFVFAESTSNRIEVIDLREEDCSGTLETEFCEASLKCKNERDTLKCICKVYPEWRGCSVLTTTTSTTSTTIQEGSHDNMRWENKKIIIPKPNCDIEIARVTWIKPNTRAYLSAERDRDKCLYS